MANKIDSNITGLSVAKEASLKVLPGTPIWRGLEPNSFSDFGGEVATVARAPIDPSRQNKKGTVTDLDASGGFNTDFVNDPTQRFLLQGFFFAAAREKGTTAPLTDTAPVVISSVTAADDKYNTGSTPGAAFNKAGLLVLASGFSVAANNGVKVVVSADTNDVTVAASPGLTNEASPPAAAKLQVVGYEFGSGTAGITKTSNELALTDSASQLASLGLTVGEWVYIGGDAASDADSFVNNKGYARIKSIAAGSIVFDDATFEGATETSTGKLIRIFFGTVIRNENDPALIVRSSYQFERTLGLSPLGDVQAEYITGAVANELSLQIPSAEKMNVDVAFVACDNEHRTGDTGDEIKTDGETIIAALGSDAINTTSDVYRLHMYVHDVNNSSPDALFAYVTEATLTINNGVTPNKAVGVLGAFDTSAGNFVVSGSLTAYFSTVEAVQAVRQNADVCFNVITAAENSGFVWDIPLLGLGGGRLNVEKDQPITIPLEPQAAKCDAGYTLLFNYFPYLPNVAMP